MSSILKYFEKTVVRFPDKIAIVDQCNHISFAELRQKAQAIALEIQSKTNEKKSPILVFLPKSIMCIVSFIGIVYSGNIYTPVDVKFPLERVKKIIGRLNPSLVITNTEGERVLQSTETSHNLILNVDLIDFTAPIANNDFQLDELLITDPLYVFYTSGSTGIPKGVTITHLNVINHMKWYTSTFGINEETIIGNQGGFHFDLSTPDVYSCLFKGALLNIIPEYLFAFPFKLLEHMEESKINLAYWVPSAYTSIAHSGLLAKFKLTHLKKILFNGELMPTRTLNCWIKNVPNIEMAANLYGPTEATVACSHYIVDREYSDSEPLPIGKTCSDVQLLLFDDEKTLITEANCKGEIHIRGITLSMGYWNEPQKTAEMFIQNPLNSHYPEHIYRTGDLGYFNERGELMFAGRRDSQIKHMGYRIELGEIEIVANGINEIKQACCLFNSDENEIYLFYVTVSEISRAQIKDALKKALPKYMVPTKYTKLDVIPTNINGKIDRLALAERYFIKMEG